MDSGSSDDDTANCRNMNELNSAYLRILSGRRYAFLRLKKVLS